MAGGSSAATLVRNHVKSRWGTPGKYDDEAYSEDYPYKTCKNDKVKDQVEVGHCDAWDFHKDFGCIYWEKS